MMGVYEACTLICNAKLTLVMEIAAATSFSWTIVLGGTKYVLFLFHRTQIKDKKADEVLLYSDLGMSLQADRVFTELEKVWQVPLESGSKVLALTVPECSAKQERLVARRNELNKRILEYKARN
jgi:hypothetical protein